jgi:hypothetical protein
MKRNCFVLSGLYAPIGRGSNGTVGGDCDDRRMSTEVTLSDQRHYPHGVPSWVDVGQTDPVEAGEFYEGCSDGRSPTSCHPGRRGRTFVATLSGHDVAGIAPVGRGGGVPVAHLRRRGRCRRGGRGGDEHGGTVVPLRVRVALVAATRPAPTRRARSSACGRPVGGWGADRQLRRRLELQHPPQRGTGGRSAVLREGVRLGGRPDSWAPAWSGCPATATTWLRPSTPTSTSGRPFAPPGFADVVAGMVEDADPEQAGWQVMFTVADRDQVRGHGRTAGSSRAVVERERVDPRGRDPRPAGRDADTESVRPRRIGDPGSSSASSAATSVRAPTVSCGGRSSH